ncbi:hypothetical protein AMR72_05475 [Flavobacterium psychrophilum]|nr:hypothetical protein AMR72_05475 [Flavobacterium psychrophilum]AOE52014.1 hypothetical protein ALW18_05470 [Flavobacterium psychrophilum]
MDLFNDKYRINSSRLPNWDYASNAVYFITICTYAKQHFFGTIVDSTMKFSEEGKIAKSYILQIPKLFSYTEIDAFVIMPNHIHILLVLNNLTSPSEKLNHQISQKGIIDEDIFIDVRQTPQYNVATEEKNEFMSKISPKKGSVSTIIRSYKSAVSKEVRKINPDFSWQERFHDHIVRNHVSYQKIKYYIINNPKNWINDKFY